MEKMCNRIKFIFIVYLALIILILNLDLTASSEEDIVIKKRSRRYLSFPNNSKFFVRFNFKANVIPWNQIFAQAAGFKLTWDEPSDTYHIYKHFHRRSVYHHVETLINRNGLDGFHCVRRAICEINGMDSPTALYYKILKIVFRKQSSATEKWHNTTFEDCNISISTCPFSLLDLSLYTDI